MRTITCDGHGRHRLRTLFSNWTVFCRDCRSPVPVVAPDEMVFAFHFKGEEMNLTDVRIGDHDAEITPELERRLVEGAREALAIKRKALAQFRMTLQETATTK